MSSKARAPNPARHAKLKLTTAENAEIALIVAGYSDDESAAKLGIGCDTFSSHLEVIFKKLNVSDRFELVLFALYYNLANLDIIPESNRKMSAPGRSRPKSPRP